MGVIYTFIVFGFVAAVVLVPQYLRARTRERMLETMRIAYERGQPTPPEVMDALQSEVRRPSDPDRDLRRAMVLIAVALALVALGYSLYYTPGGGSGAGPTMAIGAFPGFIGVGYLLLWFFSGRRTRL